MTRRGASGPDAEVATLRRYLKEIARYRRRIATAESELGSRIQEGDEDALRTLSKPDLRFVVAYAKRYQNPDVFVSRSDSRGRPRSDPGGPGI